MLKIEWYNIATQNKFKIGSDFEFRPLGKLSDRFTHKHSPNGKEAEYELFLSKREKDSTKKRIDTNVFSYSQVGFYLVTPLIMGVLLGAGIDKAFNTKPTGILFMIFLGTVGTFYNLVRIIQRN